MPRVHSPKTRPPAGDGDAMASRYADSIFSSYAAACGAFDGGSVEEGRAFEDGLQRVQEHLLSAQSEAAACLICLDNIKPSDPIWHCQEGCYEVVHLMCIQAWARQQLAAAELRAEQRLSQDRFPAAAAAAKAAAAWGCPKCRTEYPAAAIPTAHRCFCGKAIDPRYDPWVAPHSCGERCERESARCGHPCVLLCHPGPCPPCPRIVPATCHCGKVTTDKRCGWHNFSCAAPCGRRLACGHECREACHEGACPPCALVSSVPCLCGGEVRQLPCSQRGVFRCAAPCARALDCGRHACERGCHAGACGPCALAGRKACPCGKVEVLGAACDAVVPPCGGTCDKLLACGLHRCNERCHAGPCTQTCRETVERACGCGRATRTVQCAEGFRCERRCTLTRACTRHPCKRRCCDGSCPPCEEVCGRRLRCGNHKCPAPCHPGPCGPCPLSSRIACACGRTSYSVPCGREGGAQPPQCAHPCAVPALCRHAAHLPPHKCHYGSCPGLPGAALCAAACGTALPCGHSCPSPSCHDPLPPPVPEYVPPPPPAPLSEAGSSKRARAALPPAAARAAAAAAELLATLPRGPGGHVSTCPPCQVPVPVTCAGGHAMVQVPCSTAKAFACTAQCGRALACGNHACARPCHDPGSSPCAQCDLSCQRQPACGHPCPRECHGDECPPCEEPVLKACHCGKTTLSFPCHVSVALRPDQLCCTKQCHRGLPTCPHVCIALCHAGPCGEAAACQEEVALRCRCKRLKRKVPCSEVHGLLLGTGLSSTYDALTPLRLLPCDAECAKAAAAAASSAEKAAAADTAPAAAAAAAQAAPKPLSAREARQLERERLQEEKRRKERKKLVQQGAALAAVLAFSLLLALGLYRLVTFLDRKLQGLPAEEEL